MKNVEEKLDVLTLMELEEEFRNSGIDFNIDEYIKGTTNCVKLSV